MYFRWNLCGNNLGKNYLPSLVIYYYVFASFTTYQLTFHHLPQNTIKIKLCHIKSFFGVNHVWVNLNKIEYNFDVQLWEWVYLISIKHTEYWKFFYILFCSLFTYTRFGIVHSIMFVSLYGKIINYSPNL